MSEHANKQLRDALKGILGIMYEDSKQLRAVASKLDIPYETARQARDYGKGSVTSINLILHGLNISPGDLQKQLPKIRKMFDQSGQLTVLEKLLEEALNKYGQNDLIAWLRLLLARYEIERDLGIRKSAGRPRKPKK